jgi:hypothetical protein
MFDDIQITERAAGLSAKKHPIPAGLMFSVPNGNPPPGDRQFFQLGGREHLALVEKRLAWKPSPGYRGPGPEQLALEVIGQGVSSLTQAELSPEQVKQILDAWLAWAKKPAAAPEKEGK